MITEQEQLDQISEEAIDEAIFDRCSSLVRKQSLGKLSDDEQQEMGALLQRFFERRSSLIDKRFLGKLSADELQELNAIDEIIDDYEAAFYEPFIQKLRDIEQRLLSQATPKNQPH